jgi:hypothetical protein
VTVDRDVVRRMRNDLPSRLLLKDFFSEHDGFGKVQKRSDFFSCQNERHKLARIPSFLTLTQSLSLAGRGLE